MQSVSSVTIITRSVGMQRILHRIPTIAASDGSVLLIGETGVGKELFADSIHRSSPRAERPLVKIALSAIPQELLESELFGHERGAYTSAVSDKKGLFELAHTGTLFLDDIDDVPGGIQSKLLRVLESHEVMRIGGCAPISVDVRVIAATKIDLRELVDQGRFRADLYYRLNVLPLEIPPLRERREDIPLLVEHFLARFHPNREISVSPQALDALASHPWPGNVRELRNVVQRVALFAESEVFLADLPAEMRNGDGMASLIRACTQCFAGAEASFEKTVACLEIHLLRHALDEAEGNRTRAARKLGLSLSTLRDKLRKYELDTSA